MTLALDAVARVRLVPRTRAAERLLARTTATWLVLRILAQVPFAPQQLGPWLLISPALDTRQQHQDLRWLNGVWDDEFLIWRIEY